MCLRRRYKYNCDHEYVFAETYCKDATAEQHRLGTGCDAQDPRDHAPRMCCSVRCCLEDVKTTCRDLHDFEEEWNIPKWGAWEDRQDPRALDKGENSRKSREHAKLQQKARDRTERHFDKCLKKREDGIGLTNERRLAQDMILLEPLSMEDIVRGMPENKVLRAKGRELDKSVVQRYDRALYAHGQAFIRRKKWRQESERDVPQPWGVHQYADLLRALQESRPRPQDAELQALTGKAHELRDAMRAHEEDLRKGDSLNAQYAAALKVENVTYPWRWQTSVAVPRASLPTLPRTQCEVIEIAIVTVLQQWCTAPDHVALLYRPLDGVSDALAAQNPLGDFPEEYAVGCANGLRILRRFDALLRDFDRLIPQLEKANKYHNQLRSIGIIKVMLQTQRGLVDKQMTYLLTWKQHQEAGTQQSVQNYENDEGSLEEAMAAHVEVRIMAGLYRPTAAVVPQVAPSTGPQASGANTVAGLVPLPPVGPLPPIAPAPGLLPPPPVAPESGLMPLRPHVPAPAYGTQRGGAGGPTRPSTGSTPPGSDTSSGKGKGRAPP